MLVEHNKLAAKKRWSSARAACLALVVAASALASSPASASMLSRARVEASAAKNSRLGIFSTFTPFSVGETLSNPAERIGESDPSRTKIVSESREWSSPDPILASYMKRGPSGASPANLGLYSYAHNNPVVMRDPDGRQSIPPSTYDRPGHEGETLRAQAAAGQSLVRGFWNALVGAVFGGAPLVPYAAPGMVDYSNPPGAPIVRKLSVPNDLAGDIGGAVVLGALTLRLPELGESLQGGGAGGLVDPSAIRFSQSSIARTFRGGGSLSEAIEGLKSGAISPESIPPIRVFERGGQTFTLDNRRLFVFQQAGVPIRTVPATAAEVAAEAWKITTTNQGASVVVRGGGL